MRKPVPIIGKLDSASGEARAIGGVKLSGEGSRFIDCPVCGMRVDKEDLGSVLEHEELCPGSPGK